MNITLKDLKYNLKGMIGWAIGFLIFGLIGATKISGMVNDSGAGMQGLIDLIPKAIRTMFGFNNIDFSNILSLYSIFLVYIFILLAVYSVSRGLHCFSNEELDSTYEFLYVKPKKRNSILSYKILSSIIQITIINITIYISSIICVYISTKDIYVIEFIPIMIGCFILSSLCFSIGLVSSIWFKEYKKAIIMGYSIILGSYILNMIISLSSSLDNLKYICMFNLLDPKLIIKDGLNFNSTILILGISIILIIIAYIKHKKRDLQTNN
ncbi:MAG: ABC transporter permease subunit [Erysipelotrichaceae bacterium]